MKRSSSFNRCLLLKITAFLLSLTVLLTFAGCYRYNGPDYESDASDFNDLTYSRPNYSRFEELYKYIIQNSGDFLKAFKLRNSFLEMYDIYVNVIAMSGVLEVLKSLDVTDTYYADESLLLESKSVDQYDKVWEACDALVRGSGGWALRTFDGLNELLDQFGGEYKEKDEKQHMIDELMIETDEVLDDYTRLLNVEYSICGDDYQYLYQIPDKSKTFLEDDLGGSTWIITEEEIYLLYDQGFISDETFGKMLDDIEVQKLNELGECYIELVDIRNRIAELDDPGSTYYDYAYKNDFLRDFSPEDVSAVRSFVRSYLSLYLNDLVYSLSFEDLSKANALYAPDFYNDILTNAKPILSDISSDMAQALDRMSGSNYYDIEYRPEKIDLAFTSFLPVYEKSFLFIQPGEEPTDEDISTFFHEFGHYYHMTRVPEAGYANDIDTSEVLSQALELIVSKYYGQIYTDAKVAGAEYNSLVLKFMQSIITSFLVDEFEERVYKGSPKNPDEVSLILGHLFKDYGLTDTVIPNNAWVEVYHVFAYPGYYISYGVSAIAAISIFMSEDPVGSYLDFCDATKDSAGLKSTVEASGISDPFERAVFKDVCDRFVKTVVDIK